MADNGATKIDGIDAVLISDDWGGTAGLIITPEQFDGFFITTNSRIVQGYKSLGFPVIMHIDGKIWDMLDGPVDTGISGYNPVEKGAGMDLKIIKDHGTLCSCIYKKCPVHP